MPGTLAIPLLAVWVGTFAILVNAERTDKFLWFLILLAVAGVFSSMLPLAITPEVAVVANGAGLILFIVSLEILSPKHRLTFARIRDAEKRFRAIPKIGIHSGSIPLKVSPEVSC